MCQCQHLIRLPESDCLYAAIRTMRGRAPPMALSVATCTVLPTGLAGSTRCLTRAARCGVYQWRYRKVLRATVDRSDHRCSHRCTDAFCPRNNGGSKRSQHAAAPLTRSHRANTPRCGAPYPRAPTWACGTLGQALGVARRAGLARTASRPRRRGSCRARCQPRTPRADQPGSARSGKPKRVRAAKSAPELIGGRDTFLVPPSPSGRPDCTQRACR